MSKNKKFNDVPTRSVFDGKFRIKAESQEQAEEYAQKHCGLVLGGNTPHSRTMTSIGSSGFTLKRY